MQLLLFSLTCPGRARNIGRHRKGRRVETVDGNANHEHCGHCRADTRIQRNPCGRVLVLVPSSPGMGNRVEKSDNISYPLARRVVAIHPMALQHTDSGMDPPREAAAPRPSLWQLGMPSSLEIASPVKRHKHEKTLIKRVQNVRLDS